MPISDSFHACSVRGRYDAGDRCFVEPAPYSTNAEFFSEISRLIDVLYKLPIAHGIGFQFGNGFPLVGAYIAVKTHRVPIYHFPAASDALSLVERIRSNRIRVVLTDDRTELLGHGFEVFERVAGVVVWSDTGRHLDGGCVRGDVAEVVFTSGTTGSSKGVLLSELAVVSVAEELKRRFSVSDSDCELVLMPLTHSFGLARLRTCLLSGARMVLLDGLRDFGAIGRLVEQRVVTGVGLVPTAIEILRSLLKSSSKSFAQGFRYLEIGSSGLSEAASDWVEANFNGKVVWHHFGMTEASRSFFLRRGIGNVGPGGALGEPATGVQFRVRTLGDASRGRFDGDVANVGELLIQGSNVAIGYVIDGSFRPLPSQDGWFTTGDIVDPQGMRYLGRADLQVKSGGVRIQLDQLELECVKWDIGVREAIFVAEQDDVLGAKLRALLELVDGVDSTRVIGEIRHRLFKNKISLNSADCKVVTGVPRTPNGKKVRDVKKLQEFFENLK